MTVKEKISGSEGRCGERKVNRGLKKQRYGEKDTAEIKTWRYGDPVKSYVRKSENKRL